MASKARFCRANEFCNWLQEGGSMSHAYLDPGLTRDKKLHPFSSKFRSRVFHCELAEQRLSKAAYAQYLLILQGKAKLESAFADEMAEALKDWALAAGATHFTHWFQPLTGYSAEKHDAFYAWKEGKLCEQLSGKDLLKAEPDASSFPSGGLRATHAARGYTCWDPASSPFLWESAEGVTLCIPALFFSWKGEALDYKIPLLRSEQKLNKEALRLLKLCHVPAEKVYSTLGPEQEYFVIDRKWLEMRPDLAIAKRTVYGAKPPKGQELEDHYFGHVRERILSFMRDFEESALALGIPIKTRHNEVAPSQYEVAPLFERSGLAIDHNLLLMQLMEQKALHHGLSCLFHEKPFAFINGSGKHNNWSLATDTGLNLFDPQGERLVFFTLLTAVIRAVHEHAALLRASIASAGNDHRLGGSEAPPTILSVYLGEELEKVVEQLIQGKYTDFSKLLTLDLGLSHIGHYPIDSSDRNRTSFFAFTGNKFEFRAVGASAHCALPITVMQAIIADSLQLILDEIESAMQGKKELESAALPILQKHLKAARSVLFNGNGYTLEWEQEAHRRQLPNIRKSFHSFIQFLDKNTLRAFEGVLTEQELHCRYEILVEQYVKTVQVELHLMIELFKTQILPAALEDQKMRHEAIYEKKGPLFEGLKQFTQSIEAANLAVDALEAAQKQIEGLGWEAKAKVLCELIVPKMEKARHEVDLLETLVDHRLWPLAKYREMLFPI